MTRRPRFFFTLLAGTALGGLAALIELWPYPLSLRGAGATLGGGAAFGLVLAVAVTLLPSPSRLAFFGTCTLSGAIGGAAWWLLLRPSSSPLTAVVIGGVLAFGIVASEELFGQAAA